MNSVEPEFSNSPLDCCISMGSSPLASENALRVDDIGLDDIKDHPAETPDGNSPPDCCIEMGSSPISGLSTKKEQKHRPAGWCFCSFLVDDIGLEPMTFRTSSGCSSQLS